MKVIAARQRVWAGCIDKLPCKVSVAVGGVMEVVAMGSTVVDVVEQFSTQAVCEGAITGEAGGARPMLSFELKSLKMGMISPNRLFNPLRELAVVLRGALLEPLLPLPALLVRDMMVAPSSASSSESVASHAERLLLIVVIDEVVGAQIDVGDSTPPSQLFTPPDDSGLVVLVFITEAPVLG
ncbi:hypothetical protein SERLA73DRAFT_149369 [Serpula lacrymans var. lacrymans S7.3]|uniref:Uncharacterized protein n=1 Tax=Serpula lacrymans var. lacrymans (strain S7.3) TaxID=936435 RepID=F8PI89_SERL3|nr:hypothetical protein SERLA73DRAFT_149369 [Serpula lacrymans var. lacrymans S7.3]